MKNESKRNQENKNISKLADKQPSSGANGTPSYIVAIGGSAGGLEAFERFFSGIPDDTGMAFVVIQHLDPTHKALMAELLQRSIKMPVREIEDGITVESNNVYVIPPNTDLSISKGILYLSKPSEAHGHRLPIDLFFQSLAADQRDKSIAVIVSGMGTDGTLGLKAIKEVSGFVMVQNPSSAKFDGMPRSAISTGLVDYIANIDELPKELIAYVNHLPSLREAISESGDRSQGALKRILKLIYSRTNHDFSLYKKSTLYRRIEKRASLNQIAGISEYADYMEKNPNEIESLFKELFIGVTKFFRDPEAFDFLQENVISKLVANALQGSTIRVWVTACSTGEEAYSLAILLRECVDSLRPDSGIKIQIFATDIDERAIASARKGVYTANIAADVTPQRLEKFFIDTGNGYQVKKLIREIVVFALQNLTSDPPFVKMDMISCRNLLIYFSSELQRKVLPILHYSLNPNGILFLGTAEGIGNLEELFITIDSKWKVFKRKETGVNRTHLMEIPLRSQFVESVNFQDKEDVSNLDVKEALRRTLLDRYAPPSVVVTKKGEIQLVSGRTGKYLEPAEGNVNFNISAMAREGLKLELPSALHRSASHNTPVVLKGLNVKTNGDFKKVDVTVSPLQASDAAELFVITFEDVLSSELTGDITETEDSNALNTELEKELTYTKERLQTMQEVMESTSEELKSSNEELQSTNEELQSTNEELTTSKEELQSLNEELVTLNNELQSKIDDLYALNNDLVNLMNSTQIATIFLDSKLNIKRFTPAVVGTFNLLSIDIGRPIIDITQNLLYESIEQDVTKVLKSLKAIERIVESKDGHWFIMRIMPYQKLDNIFDGVVVTFSDITKQKQLEEILLKNGSLSRALNIIHTEISSTLNVDEVMRTIVVRAAEVVGVELGMISVFNNGRWTVRYVSNEDKLKVGLNFFEEQAPYHKLISESIKPLAINDTSQGVGICTGICEEFNMRSILGIPLISGGKLFGILSLISTSIPINFSDVDMDFAHKLGLAISLALTNSSLYESERQTKLDAEVARLQLEEDHVMLQQALLPGDSHITEGYQLAAKFIPGAVNKQVGGDFYDVFETENGRTAVLIGDVSGKGVESAALAAAIRSTIRAFAYDFDDPAQALIHTNSVICSSNINERFATTFLALLDPKTGKLIYSNAGHPPAMVRRATGHVDLLSSGSLPIGIIGDVTYIKNETVLSVGDQLIIYTDGISEAHKESKMLDIEGIERILKKCRNKSPNEILEALFEAALEYDGGQLLDDAAVVIIERSFEQDL